MTDYQLLRIGDVVRITSLSASTIRRMVTRNQFPQPVRVSDRSARWWQSTVRAWMQQLKEQSP